jgi:hypothetical protein
MKFFVFVLLVASALGIGGCSNVPRQSAAKDLEAKAFRQPEKGMARLYVVRNTTFGQNHDLEISINGLVFARTSPHTYAKFDMPAGQYFIGSRQQDFIHQNYEQLPVRLEEGKNHYLWQRVTICWTICSELIELSEEDGKKAVLESSLVVNLVDDRYINPINAR